MLDLLGWPALDFLSGLAAQRTGIITVATALLLPTTALLYGGLGMILAAIDTVERWSRYRDAKAEAKGREKGREEGRKEGREEGRKEIVALLKEHDVQLPQDVIDRLNGDAE